MRRDSEGPNILPGFKQPHEAPQVAQRVKNLPGMQETRVQSLDWEDPLEEGMAIHSNILAWTIPWTEEPGGDSPDTAEATEHAHTHKWPHLTPAFPLHL